MQAARVGGRMSSVAVDIIGDTKSDASNCVACRSFVSQEVLSEADIIRASYGYSR